jgi:hypothetical protein
MYDIFMKVVIGFIGFGTIFILIGMVIDACVTGNNNNKKSQDR